MSNLPADVKESADSSLSDSAPDRAFIDEFVAVQRRLYLYLLSQTASPHAAEEILQNVNVVVLSKWKQFEPGTNFTAWAYRIASLEILKYRQKKGRSRLTFDDEFVSQVARTVEEISETGEARREALTHCIGKLRKKDRELIQMRYQPGHDGKTLSEKLNRPTNSIYQSLGRIRRILMECVERQLAQVSHS